MPLGYMVIRPGVIFYPSHGLTYADWAFTSMNFHRSSYRLAQKRGRFV